MNKTKLFGFEGKLLASVSEATETMEIYKIVKNLYTYNFIKKGDTYLAKGKRYVCTWTNLFERKYEAAIADNQEEIIAFFGTEPLAQELYNKIGKLGEEE